MDPSSLSSSSLSSSLPSTVVPSSTMSSITEGAKRVELLNSLKMQEKNDFIQLLRINFGADAVKGSYGLKRDRNYHGKYQERFHCTGCADFNLMINLANEGWKILKSSVVDHGSKACDCYMACVIGNGQCKDPVTEVEITSNNKRRIRVGKGCPAFELENNDVIKKLKEATKTGKRKLTMHQISTVATSLGMSKPTIDQVKKSMAPRLSEKEVKEGYSVEAYGKALKKRNGGVEYEFSTHPDGMLKYLVIAVSGAREIFAKSQQIVYIDCAHLKSVEGNLLNAEREYIKPVMVAMTSRSFNKNNHVLVS